MWPSTCCDTAAFEPGTRGLCRTLACLCVEDRPTPRHRQKPGPIPAPTGAPGWESYGGTCVPLLVLEADVAPNGLEARLTEAGRRGLSVVLHRTYPHDHRGLPAHQAPTWDQRPAHLRSLAIVHLAHLQGGHAFVALGTWRGATTYSGVTSWRLPFLSTRYTASVIVCAPRSMPRSDRPAWPGPSQGQPCLHLGRGRSLVGAGVVGLSPGVRRPAAQRQRDPPEGPSLRRLRRRLPPGFLPVDAPSLPATSQLWKNKIS